MTKNLGLWLARPGTLSHYFGAGRGSVVNRQTRVTWINNERKLPGRQNSRHPLQHSHLENTFTHVIAFDSPWTLVRTVEHILFFSTLWCHVIGGCILAKILWIFWSTLPLEGWINVHVFLCHLMHNPCSDTLPVPDVSVQLLTAWNSLPSFLIADPWGVVTSYKKCSSY
jgi:hypothetical protein